MQRTIAAFALGAILVFTLVPCADAADSPVPTYHAVYRIDDRQTIGAGTAEIDVRYDAAAGQYEIALKAFEAKRPERVLVSVTRFRLVDDRVRPSLIRHGLESDPARDAVESVFDWQSHVMAVTYRGRKRTGSLTPYGDIHAHYLRMGVAEPLALTVAMLPGRRALADFEPPLSSESKGVVEMPTAVGEVHAEQLALRGDHPLSIMDVWLARELQGLPVRMQGPIFARLRGTLFQSRSVTLELVELQGIERSTEGARPSSG